MTKEEEEAFSKLERNKDIFKKKGVAKRIGIDPSNLSRVILNERRLTDSQRIEFIRLMNCINL